MADPYQIFDVVVGVFSLPVVTVLVTLVYTYLPCQLFPALEISISETETLLQKSTEAGLLQQHQIAAGFRSRLDALIIRTDDVRGEVITATSYFQNFLKMVGGLSKRIASLSDKVKELRVDISTISARERARLYKSQSREGTEEDATESEDSNVAPVLPPGTSGLPPIPGTNMSDDDCATTSVPIPIVDDFVVAFPSSTTDPFSPRSPHSALPIPPTGTVSFRRT